MPGKSGSRKTDRTSTDREDYFIVVVPFMRFADADEAFRLWQTEAGVEEGTYLGEPFCKP